MVDSMNMGANEVEVPQDIRDRLNELLEPDGFRQSIPGLFVQHLDPDWRAWIGVSGNPFLLCPHVGVYNEDVRRIAIAAWEKTGQSHSDRLDAGPPLIIVPIERLIGDDADCLKHVSWNYEEDKLPVERILKTSVADDLVYCFRKKAYPFFAAHMSFESIFDAARAGMSSFAMENYVPVLLVKLGRSADVGRYVQEQSKHHPQSTQRYENYANAILEIMAA
jgi:hypothetical protein